MGILFFATTNKDESENVYMSTQTKKKTFAFIYFHDTFIILNLVNQ